MSPTRSAVVLREAAERARAASAALVEDDQAPEGRVEEASMHRTRARARAAMQEQHRHAARVADLLPVHHVPCRQRQVAGLVRADFGKKVATGHPNKIP
jgi:hypothetical protein